MNQSLTFLAFCLASDFDLSQCFLMANSNVGYLSVSWVSLQCFLRSLGLQHNQEPTLQGHTVSHRASRSSFPQAQTQFKKIATIWSLGNCRMVTRWAGISIDLAALDGDERYVTASGDALPSLARCSRQSFLVHWSDLPSTPWRIESQWSEMTLCFHSVTAYLKITLHMWIN